MSDGNVAVVERLYDALKARDAQVIEQVFAPDVEIFQTPGLQWGGHYQEVEFDIAEVHVFELRDGRIVRFTAYIDTPAMLDALAKQ